MPTLITFRTTVFALVLLLVVVAMAFFLSVRFEGDPAVTVQQPGNAIIAALQRYRSEQGSYPVSLEELVPRYLDDMPQPLWGERKWRYLREGEVFHLKVGEDAWGYPSWSFKGSSSGGSWYHDS